MSILSIRSVLTAVTAMIIAFAAAYALSVHIMSPKYAAAQAVSLPASLSGFAWSANTGWISMSCTNTSTCGAVNYGVTIDASGNLGGYAWSDNIGWIQFGGLASFPAAAGNAGGNAQLVAAGADYELQGWARACAGTAPGDCSSMVSRADGWDGWVSLRGTNHSIVFVSGEAVADAFAWGSDVVGWIDFSPDGFSPVIIVNDPAIHSFTATPSDVELGGNVTLTWDIQGMTSCTASNDRGQADWSGAVAAADGSHTQVVQPPRNTTTYTLECDGSDGNTYTDTVAVQALPDITIDALSLDTLPAPNADGTYDNVEFLASVSGLAGGPDADYSLTFDGQTLTGTVAHSAGGGIFNPALRFDGVSFGTSNAVLEVDLPAPGDIPEDRPSTGADEDVIGNTRTLNAVVVPPPPPTLSIVPDRELVRVGESVTLDVEVVSSFAAECQVAGNGVNQNFITGGDPSTPHNEAIATPALQSTSVYLLQCTEPITSTTYSAETRVEVIPDPEEI